MILPDVNVLLYAFRADSPSHDAYRDWLDSIVNGETAYGMSPQVLSAVVRVSTHPRIYRRPSTLDGALSFCEVITSQPHCRLIVPGDRHWSIFERLCRAARVKGNLVTDAWFAALAIESGCEWITEDGDFARFPGLRVRSPLD